MFRFVSLLLIVLLAFTPNDARKANEAFERGEYNRAAELYQSAIRAEPNNPKLHFNLGNSLARLGRMEDAVDAFERAASLTDDPQTRAMAEYNAGTLLAETGDLEEAAERFRNSLRAQPDDEDIKYNYELAQRMLQAQQQQQQPMEMDPEQQDQEDSRQEQQEQQEQQDPFQQPSEQDMDRDGEEQPLESEMSLEEAERILEALEQRERDLLREREKEAEDRSRSDEKDW